MVVEGSSTVAGADTYDSVHPKKIFIQGLAKITSELEGDERRAELERAFHKYGGNEGAHCMIHKNKPEVHVNLPIPFYMLYPARFSFFRCYCHSSIELYVCLCRT